MTYGPTIETLDDWNYRLEDCGCCEMPACPVPVMECESASFYASRFPGFWESSSSITPWYKTKIQTFVPDPDPTPVTSNWYFPLDPGSSRYGDEYTSYTKTSVGSVSLTSVASPQVAVTVCSVPPPTSTTETWSGTITITSESHRGVYASGAGSNFVHNFETKIETYAPDSGDASNLIYTRRIIQRAVEWNGSSYDVSVTSDTTTTTSSPFPSYADEVTTFDDELTLAQIEAELIAAATNFDWDDCSSPGSSCNASGPYNLSPYYLEGRARNLRIRFQIPDTFPGSYFKITFDEVKYPTGSDMDDPANPDAEFVLQDQTLLWNGPGNPLDPESWFTDWHEVSTPYTDEIIYIRNIRYECYRSPYGSKPQVTGQAWAPPA